ncbi:MAG: ABC transporter substrate-binding protein [Parachlamydiaceae bacterium]
MNREPLALYIFRFVCGFCLFVFGGMLYWSSTVVEDRLESLRTDISSLKNEVFVLQSVVKKNREEIVHSLVTQQNQLKELVACCSQSALKAASLVVPDSPKEEKNLSQVSNNSQLYPNILEPDPFYENVLPKLLGDGFLPDGIQHVATVGKPDNLHPFSNWSQVSAWRDRCSISVAKAAFGKYETYTPDMALKMEQRPNPKTGAAEFWVFLRDDVFWQPLKQDFFSSDVHLAPQFLRESQVTAEDFKFFCDAIMNPYVQEPGAVALRTYYNDLEGIDVIDRFTFVVKWKANAEGKIKYIAKMMTGGLRPLCSSVFKYFSDGKKILPDDKDPETYRTNSVWAQNFSMHWAKNIIPSCGPWTFDGMTDRQVNFSRNRNFYVHDAALTKRYESEFKDSPDNIWQAFKNNSLDSCSLQPNQLRELQNFLASDNYKQQAAKGASVHRLEYVARSYAYVSWNETRPWFQTAKVRRALTMAIDRRRIIQENLNGFGVEITGTFYRYSPAYDDSIVPLPYDPLTARRLLEEEGWFDSDGDGVIDKNINGKSTPFSFSLTYFVKNPTTKSICEYIATALKEIGIDCRLNGVDMADLSAVFDDKNFDALCLGWTLGTPPESPRQLWHSFGAKEKGSSNAIGFANSKIDEIIDTLEYEYDIKKRTDLYHQFDAILYEEQPYTFLYAPKTIFLYRDYLKNVFIPADRQDLVPGANVAEPDPDIFWLEHD